MVEHKRTDSTYHFFCKLTLKIKSCSSSGWWFCQFEDKHGWVPASYLEPLDGPEEAEEPEPDYEGTFPHFSYSVELINVCFHIKKLLVDAGELYVATHAHKAEQDDEISLEMGETIEVIHKLLDGWWVVRYGLFYSCQSF